VIENGDRRWNRFNGFHSVRETVETVIISGAALPTLLKQGVNETAASKIRIGMKYPG
jgi:hypothetical protein